MKNKFTLFLVLIISIFFLASCGEEPTPVDPKPDDPIINPGDPTEVIDSFEVKEEEIILNFNEEKTLTITKSRPDLELSFASTNTDVAVVNEKGVIKSYW